MRSLSQRRRRGGTCRSRSEAPGILAPATGLGALVAAVALAAGAQPALAEQPAGPARCGWQPGPRRSPPRCSSARRGADGLPRADRAAARARCAARPPAIDLVELAGDDAGRAHRLGPLALIEETAP